MKLIKRLRAEKDEMKKHINNLSQEKKKLAVNLGEREKQIEHLTTKINTLKSLYESPVHETDILVRSSQPGPKKSNETLAHK
jgi:peptidoglycan hydrolase CwlO-like protein